MKKVFTLLMILLSSASGYSQWERLTSYPATISKSLDITANYYFSCSINSGAFRSDNFGQTWQEINNNLISSDSKRAYDIKYIAGRLFLSTVNGIYVSTNFGDSWELKSNGITIGPGANNIFAYTVFENNGIFLAGTFNGIYRSTDSCETWNITNISMQHTNIVVFTSFNGELYAGRDANNNPPAFKSTDNGLTWNPISIWNTFPVSSFCFFQDGDTLFTGTVHGMFRTTNAGVNWSERSTGLSADPYVSSIVKHDNVMISSLKFGGSGVFRSYNNGILWEEITDNLPFLSEISELVIIDSVLYAATSGGIYKRNLKGIVTSVFQQNLQTIDPEKFTILGNYPNPFNPVTRISFSIPQRSYIKIIILDVSGKTVKEFLPLLYERGINEFEVNAGGLSSGVYYYMVQGDFHGVAKTLTGKMILLR